MFLNNKQIEKLSKTFFPDHENHFDADNLKEANYDLRVGDEVYISEAGSPRRLDDNNPYVVLSPGQFALVKTFERVRIPNEYVALISIRSKLKFQGLINISGFHVDPTYEGHLIFAVQNVGPNDIRLRYRDPAFMIMWAKLDEPYVEEGGAKRNPGYERITVAQMAQLGGGSPTIASLQKQMDHLSHSFKIYGTIAIGILIGLIGLIWNKLS